MSSELLKQAIADAKAVRATALANAKAALEEAFTPKLQQMLSTKLAEEAEEEGGVEDIVADAPVDAAPVADEAPVDMAPVDAAPVDAAPVDMAPVADAAPVDAAPVAEPDGDEAAPVEDEVPAEEPAPVMEAKLKATTKDIQGASNEVSKGAKKSDKDVTTTLSGTELKQKSNLKSNTEDPQGQGNETSKGAKKADKNVTAPSPLKEEEIPGEEVEDVELANIIKELETEASMEEEVADPMAHAEPDADNMGGPSDNDADNIGDEEEINLDELLQELQSESELTEEKKEKEDKEEEKEEEKEECDENIVKLQKENTDYRKTVEFLRSRINEVNLLNAKLLYTTKLFKSNNLDNSQKMKVVESFDRTKSVREVKLVYTSLAESLSFGTKATEKKTIVKENKSPAISKKTVATITEGLASKPIASTAPTKAILTEVDVMASRFKKLAGIKSK